MNMNLGCSLREPIDSLGNFVSSASWVALQRDCYCAENSCLNNLNHWQGKEDDSEDDDQEDDDEDDEEDGEDEWN